MKKSLLIIFILLLNYPILYSQTVSGKLVNSKGEELGGLQLQLYINPNVYSTVSNSDGTFVFEHITNVEDKILPEGYSISNNYPNPFNPKTRINISLPKTCKVKIEVINTIGQRVNDILEKELPAGNNYIDLELNGLSNGIYLAKINIDEKYTITKKLILLYGSQHLTNSTFQNNLSLNKSTLDLHLDSLVVSWSTNGRKTFTTLPNLVGNTVDLGNLLIELTMGIPCPGLPSITDSRDGKVYETVQIGTQCWLKKNLKSSNGIEKYCYMDDENNCTAYGGLYQWDEAMQYVTTEGARGICPEGWHIPTYTEFQTLATEVNNDGNKLKRQDQGTGDGKGTDESGFSALLAGFRSYYGDFSSLGYTPNFWSSTEYDTSYASYLGLGSSSSTVTFTYSYKDYGFSVRYLKD